MVCSFRSFWKHNNYHPRTVKITDPGMFLKLKQWVFIVSLDESRLFIWLRVEKSNKASQEQHLPASASSPLPCHEPTAWTSPNLLSRVSEPFSHSLFPLPTSGLLSFHDSLDFTGVRIYYFPDGLFPSICFWLHLHAPWSSGTLPGKWIPIKNSSQGLILCCLDRKVLLELEQQDKNTIS